MNWWVNNLFSVITCNSIKPLQLNFKQRNNAMCGFLKGHTFINSCYLSIQKAGKKTILWYKNTSPQAKPKASWLVISNKMEQPQHA